MATHKGILFDFDGTLACTMEDNFEAWRAVTKSFGLELQPEDYFPYEGLRAEELIPWFFRSKPLMGADARTLAQMKDEHYLKHHRFSLYPGVEQLVNALHQRGVPMAIVTAGLRERISRSVPAHWLAKFGAIVTGEMTTRGKPHPDPYLRGAKELNLRPGQCVVIENSPLGIQAGRKANAYCVGICSTLDRSHFTEADAVVSRFEDLDQLEVIREFLSLSSIQQAKI